MRPKGFTLVEMLVSVAVLGILSMLVFSYSRTAYQSASLAASASNIRQLAAGGASYLGEHNGEFWRFREGVPGVGVRWWWGLEPIESLSKPEGERWFDPLEGPLGAYIPAGLSPDPSFALVGKPFKPKYKSGYIGVGYNLLLAGPEANRTARWMGGGLPARVGQLDNPGRIVMFATSAQVNTFQRPASSKNPMIEEFYGIDEEEVTVHFRHRGKAMVAYASGSVGFEQLDASTLNQRAPEALVGRFAPTKSTHLLWNDK